MLILVDESVRAGIQERLAEDGHSILTVRAIQPSADDIAVLALARAHGAIVLTEDKDFGELVFAGGIDDVPVVLLRLAGVDPSERATTVSALFATREQELGSAFCVLDRTGVRFRRLGPKP